MIAENIAHIDSTGIDIVYERLGDPHAPPVLLVMGLASQLIHWPDGFCQALVAYGLHVIRFDNRDVGMSTHVNGAPKPDIQAAVAGDLSSASYNLSDMAADAIGLLQAIGLASAHLVGASLGGAIAQTAAIEHPDRVRSLTSIMSSTGDRSVGQAKPDVRRVMFSGPPATTREEVVERAARMSKLVGSPGFPRDEAMLRERAGRAYDRGHDAAGIVRQAVASVASGDRTAHLRSLAVPTLVIHGAADPVCDVSGGRATAAAIPEAELVVLEGMGHDLPEALWPQMTSRIAALVQRAESLWNAARARSAP